MLHVSKQLTRSKAKFECCTILDRRKLSAVPAAISDLVIELPNRAPLQLSFGKLARFADGSCVGTCGSTSVLVTSVSSCSASTAQGFVPLTVDYRQKAAAAGRIPTNFLRRELGPSEKEILTARVIDRSIRPLFPKGFSSETQIIANLLAIDGVEYPDVIALNAASAALSFSDIPWNGPIGAVRVGYCGNTFVNNPTRKEMSSSLLNLIVAGTKDNLTVMLEGEASNLDANLFVDGIHHGLEACQLIATAISNEAQRIGKPKRPIFNDSSREHLLTKITQELSSLCLQPLRGIYSDKTHDKISRDKAAFSLRDQSIVVLKQEYPTADPALFFEAFSSISRSLIAQMVVEDGIRVDGRHRDDLRNIGCQVDLHQPLHGSALFQRGQTQVLCTVSLDSLESSLKTDSISALMGGIKEKNFFLHYEFPPYATNEIGRIGSSGRRELGHGALAEKAIKAVIPPDYPFTIRLTSEVLESNGSSSMATVCGGSLALMDAGVPIAEPVAGVAVGLVSRNNSYEPKFQMGDHAVLVDILGLEDYLGDMDFKVAGTRQGITALQADIKLPGLPFKIVQEAMMRGHGGINKILDIMHDCLSEPRQVKPNWPVSESMLVPITKRARFFGPGGVNLKKILSETGVQITQDPNDLNQFSLFAPNSEALKEAKEMIEKSFVEDKAPDFQFGASYECIITEIIDRGLFVQLHPSLKPVFIPNSQLDARKVVDARVLGYNVGQSLLVKYFGCDPASGAIRLSRKILTVSASSAVNTLKKNARRQVPTPAPRVDEEEDDPTFSISARSQLYTTMMFNKLQIEELSEVDENQPESIINSAEQKSLQERDLSTPMKVRAKENGKKPPKPVQASVSDLQEIWAALKTFLGPPLFTMMQKQTAKHTANYNQLISWRSSKVFGTFDDDLVEECTEVKNRVTFLLAESLEFKGLLDHVGEGLSEIGRTHRIQTSEDSLLDSIATEHKVLKKSVMSYLASITISPGLCKSSPIAYELKEELVKLSTKLATYEVHKSDTAELNDWLDSDELVALAFQLGSEELNQLIVAKLDHSNGRNEHSKTTDVKLFKAVLNLENCQKPLLNANKWMNRDLFFYMLSLTQKFLSLDKDRIHMKNDWRNFASVKDKVVETEQDNVFAELLLVKNSFKYFLLSKYISDKSRNELDALRAILNKEKSSGGLSSKRAGIKLQIAEQAENSVKTMRRSIKMKSASHASQLWSLFLNHEINC